MSKTPYTPIGMRHTAEGDYVSSTHEETCGPEGQFALKLMMSVVESEPRLLDDPRLADKCVQQSILMHSALRLHGLTQDLTPYMEKVKGAVHVLHMPPKTNAQDNEPDDDYPDILPTHFEGDDPGEEYEDEDDDDGPPDEEYEEEDDDDSAVNNRIDNLIREA